MNPPQFPPPEVFRNRVPLQIRFNDVDVLGHVNNTVYLTFYDTGKAYYFTDVLGRRVDWKHVDTVVANVNCSFISPIVFGEYPEVLTTCLYYSEKSFKLLQMIRDSKSGEVKSVCETVMVSYDALKKESVPLSEEWKKALERFEGRPLSKEYFEKTEKNEI